MDPILKVVLIVVGYVVASALFFAVGIVYRKKVGEREIGSAEMEATRLINEAIRAGESRKKEMLLEAKDEIHKSRTEHEKEMKERKAEISKQERRLQQKEDTLDKKSDAYERKEEELNKRLANVAQTQAQAEEIKQQQLATLEKISELTQEQAKQYLLETVENEVRHDAAMKIKEIEAQLKDEAEKKGREIIATAIQRCAADHAAETTVSVVALPNDEMKGRIIGREGRNIRTLVSFGVAPMALRMPISVVLSFTVTIIMLLTPMTPARMVPKPMRRMRKFTPLNRLSTTEKSSSVYRMVIACLSSGLNLCSRAMIPRNFPRVPRVIFPTWP